MDTQWTIEVLPEAERDLDRLSDDLREEALQAMDDLREEPRPPDAIELQSTRNHFRIRFGNRRYRILYRLIDKDRRILILRARSRSVVYSGYWPKRRD